MAKGRKALLVVGIVAISLLLYFFSAKSVALPQDCLEKQFAYQRLNCLEPYFFELTKQTSPKAAIEQAKRLQKEGVIDDCHLASHFIGEATLEKKKDVGNAFGACSIGCIEGCYHGVMEAYIGKNKELQNISSICNNVEDRLLKRQCIHGVGHGLLKHKTWELEKALETCESFTDNFSIETCQGGVFMENMNNYLLISEEALKDALPSICAPIMNKTQFVQPCVAAIGEGLMFYTAHDLQRSIELCRLLPTHQQICTDAAREEQETNKRNL